MHSEAFGSVWTFSKSFNFGFFFIAFQHFWTQCLEKVFPRHNIPDPLGCIWMHSEAFGSIWTFSKNFEIFWIFESFFNVSGRNFYKRLFSRHNNVYFWVD